VIEEHVEIPIPKTLRILSTGADPLTLKFIDPETGDKVEGLRIERIEVHADAFGLVRAKVTCIVDVDIECVAQVDRILVNTPSGQRYFEPAK